VNPGDFVTSLYLDLLQRTPSASEVQGWVNLMSAGLSAQQVALDFTMSSEYRNLLITQDYQTYLGRPPEAAALASWNAQLQQGMTDTQLASSLLASTEYFNNHGDDNASWLAAVYHDVLHRAPDPSALLSDEAALQSGMPRSSIAFDILTSPEANGMTVAVQYQQLLDRPVDPAGAATWTAALDQGMSSAQLATSLASSPEFEQVQSRSASAGLDLGYVMMIGFENSHGAALSVPNLTKDPQPIAVGVGLAGETLSVQIDGAAADTTTVDSSGSWSFSTPTPLRQGDHTFRVTSSGTGIVGTTASAFLSVDLTPPAVTLTAPEFANYLPATLTVYAAANDPYGLAPVVHIDVDLQHNGTFTDPGDADYAVATLDPGGNATVTLPQALPFGAFTLQARVYDRAGNLGVSTATVQADPGAGYVGSQPLLDLYYGLPYGTGVLTPAGWVGEPTTGFNGQGGSVLKTPDRGMPGEGVGPVTLPTGKGGGTGQGTDSSSDQSGFNFLQFDQQGRVLVNVHVTLSKYLSDLASAVKGLGMTITDTVASQGMVTGWLPVAQILALEQLPNFYSVTPAYKPILRTGSVDTEGDHVIKADTFRASTGATGAGVKVGVISDSVNEANGGLAASQATGDLPSNVQVIADDPTGNGSDEGRAMLEIVYDIAPGAALAFDTAGDTPQSMASAIQNLAGAGARVINDDIGFTDEPFFNDGVISQAAANAVKSGVFYASAAGNDGDHGYRADWKGISTSVAGTSGTFQDITGSGSPLQTFSLPVGDTMTLSVDWDSAFLESGSTGNGQGNFKVNNDIEVLITDSTGATLEQSFDAGATNTNEATVLVQFTNNSSFGTTNFAMSFLLKSGSAPTKLAWISQDNGNSAADPHALKEGAPTVFGHPMAPGVVGVAAANWATPLQPETFSALGGKLAILFDANGNRLSSPELRQTPAVTAPDVVHTTFFSTPDGSGGFVFAGTSAATPHVAGAAALLMQQAPFASNLVIAQHLEQTTLPISAHKFSPGDKGGAGLIQLVPLSGGGGFNPGPDRFDPNGTSDVATDLGTLTGTETFAGLTIYRDDRGLFQDDWWRWTAGQSGTFTSTVSNIAASGGDLNERVYTLINGNLFQLGSSVLLGGVTTQQVSVPVTAGEPIYVWVYGFNHALGTYTLTVSLG
jgi:hypothetical protein